VARRPARWSTSLWCALRLRIADRQNDVAEKPLRVAEAQRDAAYASASWTKAQGIATTVATVIALAALLIAVFEAGPLGSAAVAAPPSAVSSAA
jgi:hypothetical protein